MKTSRNCMQNITEERRKQVLTDEQMKRISELLKKGNDVAHTNAIVIYVVFAKSASVEFTSDNNFIERH